MDAGQPTRFNRPPEQFILPERVTVRDPQGSQYVIERVLAKGASGAVYLVRERGQMQRVFALKEVINPDQAERERFAFEAEVLKRLHHRALPRVYRVFENASLKRVYLLMDYIEGKNLEDLRREQPGECFSLPVVLALMAPVIDALIYLHTQVPPIVHRDIKPANIIVPTGGGEAVLVDFGSAKEYLPDSTTPILGPRSPGYAAPEQYRKGTSPSTDIYGLGATCYVLLTGITPISAPLRVTERWTTAVDPLRPANQLKAEIPLQVTQALQQAMAISVADRFKTVELFRQALLMHRIQQTPYADAMNKAQALPWERVPLSSEAQSSLKAHATPDSKAGWALRLCAILLMILAIGAGFFFYLQGYRLLLLCSLGILVLILSGLLVSMIMHGSNP